MKQTSLIHRIHAKYSQQVGSEQIATKLALEIISDHITSTRPESILEIGSGIGTITELIMESLPNSKLFCYETNNWCVNQLRNNLGESGYTLFNSIPNLVKLNQDVNFIIIDDWLDRDTTALLIRNLHPTSVFIEGHRRKQRLYVMQAYKRNRVSFRFKNFKASQDSYKGGCMIIAEKRPYIFQSKYFLFVYFSLVYSKIIEIRSKIPLRKIKSYVWKY
jgi:hypothetical protein